jgi:hypothetical protein
MAYIPKSAQRKIDSVSRLRSSSLLMAAAMLGVSNGIAIASQAPPAGPPPRRLELGVTPQQVCNQYDVYFNGEKQRLCCVADVDKGYIKRYLRGVGRKPVVNKNGKYDMELLFGKVQIVPKGAKCEQEDRKAADPRTLGSASDE